MKKTTMHRLMIMFACGICLLCGCGGKATSSEAWWLNMSDAVSNEEQDTQAAPEEIVPGYQEFALLCGLGVEEVKSTLGCDLASEEDEFDHIICSNGEGVEYWFYKDADALYMVQYTDLDAAAAAGLAGEIYLEMRMRYGEDSTYPIQNQLRDVINMPEVLESDVNDKHIKQYSEAWRQPYNMRMEEKAKKYYATDKVRLSVDLTTPLFADQGMYCISISHSSMPLNMEGN